MMAKDKNISRLQKKQPTDLSVISINHEFLSHLLTTFFVAFGALTLFSIMKSQYYGISWPTAWSYISNDQPWLPSGVVAYPIMGNHYFGDFQLPFMLVNKSIAYNYTIFSSFFPVALLPFALLGIFSIKMATFIFILATLILYFSGVLHLIETFTCSRHLGKIAAIGFSMSVALWVGIDRGAIVTGVLGLVCHVIALSYRKKLSSFQRILIVITLILCASTKVYLLTFVIAMFWTKLRWAVRPTLIGFVLTNFILTFFFGGFTRVYKTLLIAMQYQSGKSNVTWLYSGVSFSALITRVSLMIQGMTDSVKFLNVYVQFAFAVGLLWVLFVLYIVWRFRGVPDIQWIFMLSLFQYATPVSMMYTPIWASAAFVLLFKFCSNLTKDELRKYRFSLISLAIGFSIHILPIPSLKYYQVLIPSVWLISVLLSTRGLLRMANVTSQFSAKGIK